MRGFPGFSSFSYLKLHRRHFVDGGGQVSFPDSVTPKKGCKGFVWFCFAVLYHAYLCILKADISLLISASHGVLFRASARGSDGESGGGFVPGVFTSRSGRPAPGLHRRGKPHTPHGWGCRPIPAPPVVMVCWTLSPGRGCGSHQKSSDLR